jgi:hypothetical protein
MTERHETGQQGARRRLAELRPLAISVLAEVANDPKAKDADRTAAAKALLQIGTRTDPGTDKPMEDMTPAELAAYRQHLEARLAQMDTERGNDVFG